MLDFSVRIGADGRLGYGWRTAGSAARATAFWSAVTFRLLYLPMLVVGLQSTTWWLVFTALLVAHVITLLAGRTHKQ
ncbi:hypothetical protein [Halobellus clavatus]|uniref:Uncharacterized protein n=1 Tax=Halobellus clavatus TaxID=660517 RepID=A0A1H3IPC8_9EURY|nr:hypothetical protein [Halobellus clavatus]SDY28684.1 hypothetical protein SAMN04487946_11074 [Halobellus clavatus]